MYIYTSIVNLYRRAGILQNAHLEPNLIFPCDESQRINELTNKSIQ